jgi:type II secretion system protein N
MQIFKTRILWAIYIICAALFFFYYLFPSDPIKEYLADRIRQAQPYLTVKIKHVKPAFPPGLKLYSVRIYHLGQTIAGFDSFKISPNILSLFAATTHLTFEGNGYGGMLKGRADITHKPPGQEVMIDADLTGIQVNQIEGLNAVTTHKISGNLDGTLKFKSNASNQALSGDLILMGGQIELSAPVLNQNVITFDTIEADLVLNDRSLTIKRCQLDGNQMEAEVAGSIKFNRRSARKILNLSGTVRPDAALLAKMGQNVTELLKGGNLENQGFPFKITGSMDSPRYSFF